MAKQITFFPPLCFRYLKKILLFAFIGLALFQAQAQCTTTAQWSYYHLGGDSVRFYAYDTTTAAHLDWNWGDGNYSFSSHVLNHNYATPGTYNVCLFVYIPGTSCVDSLCQTITIAAPPCSLNPAWSYLALGGDSVQFLAADTSLAHHHYWSFGDGTGATSNTYDPMHVYSAPGTYHACLIVYVPGGCSDSFCTTVVVTGPSACHTTADWFSYNLGGDSVRFYASDTVHNAYHIWNWGDGTYSSNTTAVNHRFPGPGTYHVCFYTSVSGTNCRDSLCQYITIAAPCHLNPYWTSYSLGGDSVHFHCADTNSTAHYLWNWGDGTYSYGTRDTMHIYAYTGTYHVCLQMYIPGTSCTDSLCGYVTVAGSVAPCNIRWGWSYTSSGGDSISVSAEDTISAAHHIFNWGDGTYGTGTHLSHVYTAPGTYHVCFYVYLPGTTCSDSFCQNIVVVGTVPCTVSAHWSSYSLGGDSMRFYSYDTNTAAHHIWVWGDGTYSSGVTVINHHYPLPGTYHVCYFVYIPGSNCSDSMCDNITIPGATGSGCNITANWTYYSVGSDSFHFYAYDTNTAAHHVWTFGDGTYTYATRDPWHTYHAPGTYTVCLYVYLPGTSCADSSCRSITIAPPATPPCTTTALWASYSLGGDSMRFYAADTNHAAHHIWNWGDGTYTSGTTIATHTFPGPGTYHVCFYVYIPGGSCSDSLCDNVTIGGSPCSVNAYWSGYGIGGDSVRFYAADTNHTAYHVWVWGDGTYSSGSTSATHAFADTGSYTVCFYVYIPGTACIDSFCRTIHIGAGGHVALSAVWNSNPLGGDTIGFVASDSSTMAAYEIWSFGDGTYAFNTTNPTHIFPASGTYTVCYYVIIPNTDLADTVCQTITVVLNGIGTVENAAQRIIVQPNPFGQSVQIRAEGLSGSFDFKLYDMVGKLLVSDKGLNGLYNLQRGNLASGIYLFELSQNGRLLGKGKLIAE